MNPPRPEARPDDRDRCLGCGRPLIPDERSLTRKLVNRGATRFFCLSCLAARFEVGEDVLRRKIEQFRADGCLLFL